MPNMPSPFTQQAIDLQAVSVCYPGAMPVVRQVNVRFAAGSSWALLGPNGAGKSTLLKAAMRLLPCAAGRVVWQGLTRRDIAYLPQQSDMDRSLPLTVFELAAMGLWHELGLWRGITPAQEARVHTALQQVGMAAWSSQRIDALSNGQFQRVLFARLLVQDAPFLLLDEPFNAIDATTTQALLQLLRGCMQQGACVVAVVHDSALACAHFKQALVLAGQIAAVGACADVLTDGWLQRAEVLAQAPAQQALPEQQPIS